MTSPILLTGGTGTLGRHVLPLLRQAGADVRVLSRSDHESRDRVEYVTGDLLTGEGIDPAVDGAETIVHLAGGPRSDEEATRNLVRAASRAEVQHVVYISVIGAGRVPLGWLRFQPVDSGEVAARLVELALDKPAGLVPDLAGPKVYGIADLIRGYLQASGKHRLLMPVRIPGKAGRAYRSGENLSLEGAAVGERTWEDFLAERSRTGWREPRPVAA